MFKLKLIQIGDSVGLILPKEVLVRLKLGLGDTLLMSDVANGVTLTSHNPEFEAQLTAARRIMKKRWTVSQELGK